MFTRRALMTGAGAAMVAAGNAAAQTLPKLITIIVPFAPGGGNDILARELGRQLAETTGISVVIENRGGAGGLIAAKTMATAQPNGATLMFVSSSFVTSAAVRRVEPYNVAADYTPLSMIARGPLLLVASPQSGLTSVKDIVARSKAEPGVLTYLSSGVGSILHLATEVFMFKAGIKMTHVPYTGSGPALMDLIAGRGDLFVTAVPTVLGQLQDKSLNLLAVTSDERSSLYPQTPTIVEGGVGGVNVQTWWGVVGPPNLPRELATQLNTVINEAAATAHMRKRFEDEGASVVKGSPEQFAQHLKLEHESWRQVVEVGNLYSN